MKRNYNFLIAGVIFLLITIFPCVTSAAVTGELDLNISNRIPRPGNPVFIEVDTRTGQSGIPVALFYGSETDTKGHIASKTYLISGVTNNTGKYYHRYIVKPSDVGKTYYLVAYSVVNQKVLTSNLRGLTVTPSPADADFILTPASILRAATGVTTPTNNPIQIAYEWAQSGDVILLENGAYPPPWISKFGGTNGGSHCGSADGPHIWIMARNPGNAVIQRRSGGGSHTIIIWPNTSYTTFVGLHIMGSDLAGIITCLSPTPLRHIRFFDCVIDGGYDHATQSGPSSKWGYLGNMDHLLWRGGAVRNIQREHAFYFHNIQGGVTIEDATIKEVGRTAFQDANRPSEGPPGTGNIQLRNLYVKDTGLGDGGHGGMTFTFMSNNDHDIVLDNIDLEIAFDQALLNGVPGYVGTGAFASWDENKPWLPKTKSLTVRNCSFEIAPGMGDRSFGIVGAVDKFTLEGNNFIKSGVRRPLDIHSDTTSFCLNDESTVIGDPNQQVYIYGQYLQNYTEALAHYGTCAPEVEQEKPVKTKNRNRRSRR
ncbi:hypothetical protein ACFL96_02355 [Thermoproteota archaeon]